MEGADPKPTGEPNDNAKEGQDDQGVFSHQRPRAGPQAPPPLPPNGFGLPVVTVSTLFHAQLDEPRFWAVMTIACSSSHGSETTTTAAERQSS